MLYSVLMASVVLLPLILASAGPDISIRQIQEGEGNDIDINNEQLTNITLRGGVLLAPPFAIYNEITDTYTGFQGDLLKSLEIFALQDGYNLTFELSKSPSQYGDALDLVANDCNTTTNPNLLEDCNKFDLIIGDYYCNADRSTRVDFSPTFLRTTMSTLKIIKDEKYDDLTKDYTTLTQLQSSETGTACVPGKFTLLVSFASLYLTCLFNTYALTCTNICY